MLTIKDSYSDTVLQTVLQTTFVTREIFEMNGTDLFVTNETGSRMGRVKRVDDNTVNFFDFKTVKKAYLFGFY